jgi:co-chaperonin GroES (HSP10)
MKLSNPVNENVLVELIVRGVQTTDSGIVIQTEVEEDKQNIVLGKILNIPLKNKNPKDECDELEYAVGDTVLFDKQYSEELKKTLGFGDNLWYVKANMIMTQVDV